MRKVYCFESDNNVVTSFYLDIIKEALSNIGFDIISVHSPIDAIKQKISHNSWFLTTGHKNTAKLWAMQYKNIINWFQGLPAEEDFLQSKNKIRYHAINLLDRITFKYTKYGFYVSNEQINYFEKKFNFTPKNKFIMPCFNENIKPISFATKQKYNQNKFCYVGAIGAWQRFDDIISLYEKIEQNHPDCFLKILTYEAEAAKELIAKHNILNYSIKCVPGNKVSEEIADCKFGFILRHDTIINNVATPTKLSNYLANGIIPIVSDSIKSYKKLAEIDPYIIIVNDDNAYQRINEQLNTSFSWQDVLAAHQHTFDIYFNRSLYVKKISESLNSFLKTAE